MIYGNGEGEGGERFSYQDDMENKLIEAGQESKDRHDKAKEERDKKNEEDRQIAIKEQMLAAGQVSRDRRQKKTSSD